MREDMADILSQGRGSRPGRVRGNEGRGGPAAWEELPRRERMRCGRDFHAGADFRRRPLERFLLSRVGRPWDEVFSEICARLPKGSRARREARIWLDLDKLEAGDVGMLSGALRGIRLRVCPKSGLLLRLDAPRRGR
jgi:hypothetical protein